MKKSPTFRFIAGVVVFFFTTTQWTVPFVHASDSVLGLPTPGSMVRTTPHYEPTLLLGMTINADNPLQFDFLIDKGHKFLDDDQAVNNESSKLIKYFLTSLTVPPDQLWVNLSPYEKDRIIPEEFGRTEMGRDLLAQDYLLKQLTASLMYPEDKLGAAFWDRVYQKAQSEFGNTDITVNTFNKIWIVPEKADVYVNGQTVFIVNARLKVMLEQDYLALSHHTAETEGDETLSTGVSSKVIREVLIPEIEHEVNNGETFALLRQIYYSMILASWYKNNLKESFLSRVYVDKAKTGGVESADRDINKKIYDQYVTALEEGVYNYIKEEYDPELDEVLPKKYFSGGVDHAKLAQSVREVDAESSIVNQLAGRDIIQVSAGMTGLGQEGQEVTYRAVKRDQARLSRDDEKERVTLMQALRGRLTNLSPVVSTYTTDAGIVIDRLYEELPRILARNKWNGVGPLILVEVLLGMPLYMVSQLDVHNRGFLWQDQMANGMLYAAGLFAAYKVGETGYLGVTDVIRFLRRSYRTRSIDALKGESISQFRVNFGSPDDTSIDLANLLNPQANLFSREYINGYYAGRFYRGDYEADRATALKSVRITPRGKISANASAQLQAVQQARPELGLYSPVLRWKQRPIPGVAMDSFSVGGKATLSGELLYQLAVTVDAIGDQHYGGWKARWPLHGYLEPFFNVPRSASVIDQSTGQQGRTLKFLTDATVSRMDLVPAEDSDTLEMLPIKDPVRSMISSGLLNVLFDSPEKVIRPYIEGQSATDLGGHANQIRRADGSTYIFGLESSAEDEGEPAAVYDLINIGSRPQNAVENRKAMINIFATIGSIEDAQERQQAIEYFAETLFFMANLMNLRHTDKEEFLANINQGDRKHYAQLLMFPYYVYDLLVNKDILSPQPKWGDLGESEVSLRQSQSLSDFGISVQLVDEMLTAFDARFGALDDAQREFIFTELGGFDQAYRDAIQQSPRQFGQLNWTQETIGKLTDFVQSVRQDRAVLSSNQQVEPVGGIDLNPQNVTITTSGQPINLTIPPEFIELQGIPVEGFVPVIINVTPVSNLPLLLGLEEDLSTIETTRSEPNSQDIPQPEIELLSYLKEGVTE